MSRHVQRHFPYLKDTKLQRGVIEHDSEVPQLEMSSSSSWGTSKSPINGPSYNLKIFCMFVTRQSDFHLFLLACARYLHSSTTCLPEPLNSYNVLCTSTRNGASRSLGQWRPVTEIWNFDSLHNPVLIGVWSYFDLLSAGSGFIAIFCQREVRLRRIIFKHDVFMKLLRRQNFQVSRASDRLRELFHSFL